ncbi:HNH endonuclease signature motif containing protein [Actinoplanes sp. TFC3]|uniref:HNH endonuclease signature motif containing protein n=1 Tax=Actinoplanes sp. TFC3 TaxID=1710355 RepID=UPI00082CEFDB|nr:HNH endonuclease signature motif containing protein [Actinoplanes sp. TFC3]
MRANIAGVMTTLERLDEDVAELADASVWALSDAETVECMHSIHRASEALMTVQLQLVHQAEIRGLPAEHKFKHLASWLRAELRIDPTPAREMAERSRMLECWPRLRQAVLDGHTDIRQAEVIASALSQIPETVNEVAPEVSAQEIVDKAERMLIGMAGDFPAYQLRRLGQRILDHVAPEIAERAEELALERQEARARQQRGFTLSLPRDGLVHLTGALTVEDAATVKAALEPLCRPCPADDRTPAQQRADALVDVCQLALRTGDLPSHGGEPPQLSVTVAYDSLTQQVGIGTLDNGERLSAEAIRRLACDARILPYVLGGAGQVLDAGRSSRTATGPLRRAVLLRDGGCAFPGCDAQARWAKIHHIIHWFNGGTTDLPNLVALCGRHHVLMHDPSWGWQVRMGADGLPEFIPPTWVDPQQVPQRNQFHPRK